MPLDQNQIDAFRRDGFIIVDGLFDPEEMAAARSSMEELFYGKSFSEYLAEYDRTGKAGPVEVRAMVSIDNNGYTEYGSAQFPTGLEALDRLITNEEYLRIFAQCLGTNDVSYCNSGLFMRSGPTDQRHSEHPWQGYHVDHFTNSFLPPSEAIGLYEYINSWVFLHDIDTDGAPIHVIPGSHHQATYVFLRLGSHIDDIRKAPELAEPIPAVAKAGSVLLYSSCLIHAASPFTNMRKQRAVWTLSMGRGDTSAWTRLTNAWNSPERAFFERFWQKTTPMVRSLFGWPAPGHAYYTEKTLKGIAIQFPNMDLSPYQEKIGKQ